MLLVLGLVVGLVGPFGTFETMAMVPRLAYWMAIVVGTSALGAFVAGLAERVLPRSWPPLAIGALAGAAAGPAIALFVLLLNIATFGPGVTPIGFLTLLLYCTLISAAVTALSALFAPAANVRAADAVSAAEPALLQRLPRPQRGRLIHIAVSDHYVDVTTDKGTSLVLMRLSDAIRETAPVPGLQVHRSHWVALDAVRRGTRREGKPVLELENGTIVPVSRSYLDAVRAAGLL